MDIQAKAPAKKSLTDQVRTLTISASSEFDTFLLARLYDKLIEGHVWTQELINEAREAAEASSAKANTQSSATPEKPL